jgi:hypothetical protein
MRHPKPKRFYPQNPQKYYGNVDNIICRSRLEKRFFDRFDSSPSVIGWGSEEISIPYFNPLDKDWHHYFPDNILKVKRSNGEIRKILIEIKPKAFCSPPKKPKRANRRYVMLVQDYIRNHSKWLAARAWCLEHHCEFQILTEEDLRLK